MRTGEGHASVRSDRRERHFSRDVPNVANLHSRAGLAAAAEPVHPVPITENGVNRLIAEAVDQTLLRKVAAASLSGTLCKLQVALRVVPALTAAEVFRVCDP